MSQCAHEHTQPVEVRDHRDGGTRVVAQVCADYLDAFPAGWGCGDCVWTERRRVCDEAPQLALTTPCTAHRGDTPRIGLGACPTGSLLA